jgi:hypothetical protein
MNEAYLRVISAPAADRRDLFAAAARRIGTAEQNVEKDFWVCWTLDALFHRLPSGGPRLLFKGGTSLSKAFGLIDRFSEDIDITVFRDDLGQRAPLEELERLTGKKRRERLDAIRDACRRYIHEDLRSQLESLASDYPVAGGTLGAVLAVVPDETDADGQTLLVRYPSATSDAAPYVQPSLRIEAGAKSALDPNVSTEVEPYVAIELESNALRVGGITTIESRRTFWDKVVIVHGLRRWFENRGELRQEGQRVSRHYYDLHCLLKSRIGPVAIADMELGSGCVRHARMFFDRAPFDLASAVPGTFAVAPAPGMLARLERDYDSMAGMIFGPVPAFNDVLESLKELQERLNRTQTM